MNEDRDCPLKTKRLVVGQITICRGCCCGNVERGLPEVPVEWLKSEWRKRGLLKRVQLTISGCVGPCDVPNVVVITTSSGTEWLGNIVRFDQYRSLVEWAVRCRDAGEMLALPREFQECRISPFSRRDLGNPWEMSNKPSITREWPERAESSATTTAASTQIKAAVDSSISIGGATQ